MGLDQHEKIEPGSFGRFEITELEMLCRDCVLVLMQYWKKNKGGIIDQTGGKVIPILAHGNHDSPFLIPSQLEGSTKNKRKKEKKGGTHETETTTF